MGGRQQKTIEEKAWNLCLECWIVLVALVESDQIGDIPGHATISYHHIKASMSTINPNKNQSNPWDVSAKTAKKNVAIPGFAALQTRQNAVVKNAVDVMPT